MSARLAGFCLNFGWKVLSLQAELQCYVLAVRIIPENEKEHIHTGFAYHVACVM